METLGIANHLIGIDQPCFIVAEIGINHNGDVKIADRLIESAKKAGCYAVKFQKRTVSVVYSQNDLAKKRQIPPTSGIMQTALNRGVLPQEAVGRLVASEFGDTTNGDLKWALEFVEGEYREIDTICKKLGIVWFASPWDEKSVDFLEQFNVPCYKVASASLTDDNLIRKIRATGKPIIMSTGMSTMDEIKHAVDIVEGDSLILMHTVSEYPPNDSDLNLRMIPTLRREFPNIPIGYSGHEKDILPSLIAVVLGACMVERHLTLDRRMWGTDHAASLEPEELALMVAGIERIAIMLNDGKKRVSPREVENMKKLRRTYGFGGG